jgi:hypothetical protein
VDTIRSGSLPSFKFPGAARDLQHDFGLDMGKVSLYTHNVTSEFANKSSNDEEIGHSLFTYTRENQRCNPERRNTKVSAVLEGDHTSVRAQLCAKFQCMEQHKLPESGKCPCHNHLVLVWQSFLVTDETKRRKRYERTLLAVNSGDLKHPENSQRPQLGINRLEKMMNGKKQRTGPQRSHTLCCLANNTGRVKACDKASTLHDVLVERMNNPKLPKVKCGEVFENERRAENEELKQQGIEELELEQEHLELERKELKEKQPEGAANRMSWEWEGDDNERDDD